MEEIGVREASDRGKAFHVYEQAVNVLPMTKLQRRHAVFQTLVAILYCRKHPIRACLAISLGRGCAGTVRKW